MRRRTREALSIANNGQRVLGTEEEFGGGAGWGHVQNLPGLALWAVQGDNHDAGPCGLRPDSPETGEGALGEPPFIKLRVLGRSWKWALGSLWGPLPTINPLPP